MKRLLFLGLIALQGVSLVAMQEDEIILEGRELNLYKKITMCPDMQEKALEESLKKNPKLITGKVAGSGDTLLHFFAGTKRADLVRLLLQMGADLYAVNFSNESVIDRVSDNGVRVVIEDWEKEHPHGISRSEDFEEGSRQAKEERQEAAQQAQRQEPGQTLLKKGKQSVRKVVGPKNSVMLGLDGEEAKRIAELVRIERQAAERKAQQQPQRQESGQMLLKMPSIHKFVGLRGPRGPRNPRRFGPNAEEAKRKAELVRKERQEVERKANEERQEKERQEAKQKAELDRQEQQQEAELKAQQKSKFLVNI